MWTKSQVAHTRLYYTRHLYPSQPTCPSVSHPQGAIKSGQRPKPETLEGPEKTHKPRAPRKCPQRYGYFYKFNQNLYFFLCIVCHISSPKCVGIIGTQVVWSSQVKRGCVILCEPHLTPLCKIIISHLLRTQLWCAGKNIYTSWQQGFLLTGSGHTSKHSRLI